jgi:hypothetical protein
MSGIVVNAYPSTTAVRAITLTGTNETRIVSLYLGGASGRIVAVTPTSWKAEVKLLSGTNRISIYGIDDAGNTSASVEVTIVLGAVVVDTHQVFNHFSEHGIPRALPQILGEKNHFYRNRLLEVFKRPTDTTVPGIHFGTNRELSTKYYPGFKIRARSYTDGTLGATNAVAYIDDCVLLIECDEFYSKDELVQVEAGTDRFTLDEYPIFDSDFRLVDLQGQVVPMTSYKVVWRDKTVTMSDTQYRDQRLRVTYRYRWGTSLYSKTLAELDTEVSALTSNGRLMFGCSHREPTWDAQGLFSGYYPIAVTRAFATLWWARVRLHEMHNHWFRQHNLNTHGAAYGTKLEAWAAEANSRTAILWRDTKLDQHYWNIIPESVQTFGTLPHLWNSYRGHWDCADPTHDPRYTMIDFLRYSGVCPDDATELTYVGVEPQQWQNGTGGGDDLLVVIEGFGQ